MASQARSVNSFCEIFCAAVGAGPRRAPPRGTRGAAVNGRASGSPANGGSAAKRHGRRRLGRHHRRHRERERLDVVEEEARRGTGEAGGRELLGAVTLVASRFSSVKQVPRKEFEIGFGSGG